MSEPCPRCDRTSCKRRETRLPEDVTDCVEHAIDWRARALAAEAERDKLEHLETRTIERVAAWLDVLIAYGGDGLDMATLNILRMRLCSGAWRKP
jgi:hypothetical protein